MTYLTVIQFAKRVNVSHQWIYELIKADKIKCKLIAGIKLIPETEVNKYLNK